VAQNKERTKGMNVLLFETVPIWVSVFLRLSFLVQVTSNYRLKY